MDLDLTDLLKIEPLHGGSINGWIQIPSSFIIVIYYAIISITTVTAVFFVVNKNPLLRAYQKSFIIAFFFSGFLYLAYSERTWYAWFSADIKTYYGHPAEVKPGFLIGPLYDFISVARELLSGNDYVIYSSDNATRLMTQYYLLPMRNRANAKYAIVLHDTNIAYDDHTKSFVSGGVRRDNAEILFRSAYGAYILRFK